jgi:energy-coupling factor transporter ATP-binding protein EcfA2
MKDRIRLSAEGSYFLTGIKRRLNLFAQPNYVPMRIAFGRSLMTERDPVVGDISAEIKQKAKDQKGNEQPEIPRFEQGQGLFFQTLLTQRYGRKVEGDDYVDLLAAHVEHGLWLIYNETEKISGFDYLMSITNAAQNKRNLRENPSNTEGVEQSSYTATDTDILSVRIGVDKKNQKPIVFDVNTANNPHFGIMGGSGSGKTYFLKHLLTQIRHNSNYDTHFIIFDYAKGDIANDRQFLMDTNAELLNVKESSLPLNIFAAAVGNEREQKAKAENLVNVFKNVEANFGKVQEDNLYNAIIAAYNNAATYPDFDILRQEVLKLNPKPDTLTSILRPLVEQNYFAKSNELIWGSWTNKTLIVDLHQIERKDLVCFLILDHVFSELKRLGDAPFNTEKNARKIRTVVVIDEAHNFLSSPKRAKILERMIREVRSMGGMVVLASQSPDDYNTSAFDFLELLEFPIVLKSTPQSHKFLEQKFSLTTSDAKDLLKKIGQLERGEGFFGK